MSALTAEETNIVRTVQALAQMQQRKSVGFAKASNGDAVRNSGGDNIVGVMTTQGNFIGRTELENRGLSFTEKDGSKHVIYSTEKRFNNNNGVPQAWEAREERNLSDDKNPYDFNVDNIIETPWPFEVLSGLMTSSTMHGACVETKASDYTYCGYRLETIPWAKDNIPEDTLELARDEVESFLASVCDGRGIENLYRDVAMDYEGLGTAGFEIRRDAQGFISRCNHVPFKTMRVTKKRFFEATGARYLQRRWQKKIFFSELGANIIFKDINGQPFDPTVATPDVFPNFDMREAHIEGDGTYLDYATAEETLEHDRAANEFLLLARPPFTKSAIYGTPAGFTAYSCMLAQMKIDEYNLQFFSNKGVPQYAVVFKNLGVSGGDGNTQLGAVQGTGDGATAAMITDDTTAMENTVHEFFMKKLSQGDRSILLLTLYGEAEVTFEKLSSDEIDASFENYEERNNDKIRIAHRVPNSALGIDPKNASGLSGGSRDVAQMRRYRDHIVAPGQQLFEGITNQLIRCGLLIPYFKFKFLPMNIEEEQAEQEFALKEWEAGAITRDQYYEKTGREPLPDSRGQVYKLQSNEQFISADETAVDMRLTEQAANEQKRMRRMLSGQKSFDELDNIESTIVNRTNMQKGKMRRNRNAEIVKHAGNK